MLFERIIERRDMIRCALCEDAPCEAVCDKVSAAKAMAWAAACGVLKADAEGNIRPSADATRGEIARAIHDRLVILRANRVVPGCAGGRPGTEVRSALLHGKP